MTGPPRRPRRRRSEGPRGGPAGTRAARPSRVPLRSRSRGSQILTYAHRIQERDIEILFDLHEHRVLTTRQVRDLHFNCYRVAGRRLLSLFELDLVTRFRPPRRTGSHPYHYTLEEPGALIVATRLDIELKQTGFRRDTPKRIAKSIRLDHWVETNDFFCHLAWSLRTSGAGSLIEWWGERRCRGLWDLVEPDGLGRIRSQDGDLSFFLELDRGTENHDQLRAKSEGYADMPLLEDTPRLLLFSFPTPRREAEARRAIETPGMSVATTVRERVTTDPLGPVWQPLGHPFRVPILELPEAAPLPDPHVPGGVSRG